MRKVNFEDRENEEEKNDEIDLNQISVFGYDDTELNMRRLPWSLWILTIVCFLRFIRGYTFPLLYGGERSR